MILADFFTTYPRAALGFSGGVDSAYLLYAALACHAQVRPYYIKTAFQPAFELADAQRLCQQLGVELQIIERDILSLDLVSANSKDRCYHCKKALFSALKAQAQLDGYSILLDGTNASDEATDRPGMRALDQLKVLSPLRECGLTKPQIRQLSRAAGLFTWDKPAYACLATRVPTGQPITKEDLHRVEEAESALSALGFRDFRVRLFHGGARIQVPEPQLELVLSLRQEILQKLSGSFDAVMLDLQIR